MASSALLLFVGPPTVVSAETLGPSNLAGQRGILHLNSARTQPAHTVTLGTSFQYFSASGFLPDFTTAGKDDHTRLRNAYLIAWTPWKFLELSAALHMISDNSSGSGADELQVTVGDPKVAVKGSYQLLPNLTLGGALQADLLSEAGFFSGGGALRMEILALASYQVSAAIPLEAHLNIGYTLDRSEDVFEDPSVHSPAQLYGAQVSSFDRIPIRVGLQYLTTYIAPFLEFTMAPLIGSGARGLGDSPSSLSIGASGWVSKAKGVQLLAALDLGLSGVSAGDSDLFAPGKIVPIIPRWNLLLGVSYRFDPNPAPTIIRERITQKADGTVVSTATPRAAVTGKIIDAKSLSPIWNARLTVEGAQTSALAVDPQNGTFRTYDLENGAHRLTARAEGYESSTVDVDVDASGASIVVQLTPKTELTPGTLRGNVKTRRGKRVRGATMLIPALDRTMRIPQNGAFSLSIKPGVYQVVFAAKGYRSQTKTIRILEGTTVILNVELYR